MTELHDIIRKIRMFENRTKINAADADDIKRVIGSYGYKVIEYNRFANSEAVASLLGTLRLTDYSKQVCSFTYCDKNNKFVFLRNGLDNDDKRYVLLHELGHIYLKHLTDENYVLSSSVKNEFEANEFAHCIIKSANRKNSFIVKNKKTIIMVAIAAVCIAFLGLAYANYSDILLEDKSEAVQNKDVVTEESNSDIDTTTQQTINSSTELTEFYVTTSGKKYHLKNCMIIKNKTNIRSLTKQELEDQKYEPCKICMPDAKR